MTNQQFSDFYNETYKGIVYYTSAKVNFNKDRAMDIAQSAYITVLEASRKRKGIENPKAYLISVIDNLVKQGHRVNKLNDKFLNEITVHGEFYTDMFKNNTLSSMLEFVQNCLNKMPENVRVVMNLVIQMDQDSYVADACEQLGIAPRTFHQAKAAGLAFLSKEIKKAGYMKVNNFKPKEMKRAGSKPKAQADAEPQREQVTVNATYSWVPAHAG